MRRDPGTMLRGVGKLVVVVLLAGLAGAGIGLGLAQLSGDGGAREPDAVATSARTTATAATAATTATTATTASTTPFQVPLVKVLSARLSAPSAATGRARVDLRIRLTNRNDRPLDVATPRLLTGEDEVPLDRAARGAARPLLGALVASGRATGRLRFTLSRAQAQRLSATPSARLRIARRSVLLTFAPSAPRG